MLKDFFYLAFTPIQHQNTLNKFEIELVLLHFF